MIIRRVFLSLALGTGLALGLSLGVSGSAVSGEATVIDLTQTACQFVESENGIDHGFTTAKKADCISINHRTGAARSATVAPLRLKPGKYVFRVTNQNVPYALGFWLRGAGVVGRVTLPSVSGGGLAIGTTRDYPVELVAGEYLYSCPLNPTPDYKIIVES